MKTTLRKRRVERRDVNDRAVVIFSLLVICLLALLFKVAHLQIAQHEHQKKIAVGNTIKSLYISPERGDVFDRNGELIASVRPKYDLAVIPEKIPSYHQDQDRSVREFLEMLRNFIELPEDSLEDVTKDILKARSYAEVVVKSDLPDSELATLLANTGLVDGITVRSRKVRNYLYPEIYASALGHVGRVDASDLKRAKGDGFKLLTSDLTGKSAVEKRLDSVLYGKVGKEVVALNSRGRVVERQIANIPTKGSGIALTLDHELQMKAAELMKGRRGAIVMTNVNTGELLTLLSFPSMDVNKFVTGLSKEDAKEIFSESAGRPLYNRATRGQYPPASTIKPFMVLAGIEGEFIDPYEVVNSGPHYKLGGLTFRDWKRWGHGKVDAVKAVAVSSDVYFYKLANKMGVDYIHDYLAEFGFGQATGFEFGTESTGLLPSSDWKRKVKGEPWYAGESLNVGIGQGYFMVTPMQLTMATSMLVNGGKRLQPTLIRGAGVNVLSTLNIPKKSLKPVLQGMVDVIHSKSGTARSIRKKAGGKIAGKTGTAQVYSTNGLEKTKNEDLKESLRDHALFMGYYPYDAPEVAITVFVENGSSGSKVAAPIAAEILDLYAKKYEAAR